MFQMEQKMCKGTKSVQGVNRVFSVRKGFLNIGLYFLRNLFKKAFQISDVLLFLATFKGHYRMFKRIQSSIIFLNSPVIVADVANLRINNAAMIN